MPDLRSREFTRRQFLTYRAVMSGSPTPAAIEAVANIASAHPEWDMDESMTWAEWDAQK